MKHILKNTVFAFLGTILFVSCSSEPKETQLFTIKGEIEGLSSHLYFRHPDKEYSRENPSDSIIVTDGKFSYTDSISELKLIRAYIKDDRVYKKPPGGRGYYPVKSMYLMFFAFPGAEVSISGEITDYVKAFPEGDEYNNGLAAINKITFPNYSEVGNLMVQMSGEEDPEKKKEIEKKAEALDEKGKQERIKHIKENPGSIAVVWYLEDMIMRTQVEDDQAIELFNNISKELADLSFYKSVEARINGIIATQDGKPVPSIITTSTLDGKEFNIASLKGKYVLIDFWGLWCGPCVSEMPEVKKFQEKHKEKLVVLGINSGDTKKRVQEFVAKNNYTWQQLMSVRNTSEDNFVNRFNVQGFPTKIILDPDGTILKRYVGSGEEAFKYLEELMK